MTLLLQPGLGDSEARLRLYVAKAPPMAEFAGLNTCLALLPGQIDQIYQHCGNGWRKVFNVYAKLVWALPAPWQPDLQGAQSWQQWRDRVLLQAGSGTALLFGANGFDQDWFGADADIQTLHIIAGRQHARDLLAQGLLPETLTGGLVWLDEEFAVAKKLRLLVCPYLDYRQLSDIKIARLVQLVRQWPDGVDLL
ncbi:hypothetical protein [Rheinheimera texasensis]|uniref:DUF6942 family protein n=1 Tax=Rheinheimera texasensis TaxID=306205 RepID=UPI0032B1A928